MTKINLLPFLYLMFAFGACSPKLHPNKNSEYFTLKSIFTQSEIPGHQDAVQKNYFHLNIVPNADKQIVFEQVLFDGKIFTMGTSKGVWKFDRSTGRTSMKQYKIQSNEALLFYTVAGKEYRSILPNVEQKTPIYLP